MHFNKHLGLEGAHAFLSASKYHWTNYSEDKLIETFRNSMAAQRGSELHELASRAIRLGIKFQGNTKTIARYVNDAIGYRMEPEQILFYSINAFGTADAISFRKNLLRVHDFKSGVTKASMRQLEIYAALFCLEYNHKPGLIDMELRIYQEDDVQVHFPETEAIVRIMDTIIAFDKRIEMLKGEAI